MILAVTDHYTITTFTQEWWTVNLISFSVIALFIYLGKMLDSEKRDYLTKFIATVLILRTVLVHPYHMFVLNDWDVTVNLPLHLCGLSAILSGLVLLYPKQMLYELLFFWGLPGAFHSFMTPEFTGGHQGILYVEFFISHGGILLSALYLTMVKGMKPRVGSWWKVFLYSQLLIPTIGFANYLLDANYMFLCEAPIVANPFIFTREWPWYILGIDMAALVHYYIVYLLSRLKKN